MQQESYFILKRIHLDLLPCSFFLYNFEREEDIAMLRQTFSFFFFSTAVTAAACCVFFPYFSLCIGQRGAAASFTGWNYIAFNIYRGRRGPYANSIRR